MTGRTSQQDPPLIFQRLMNDGFILPQKIADHLHQPLDSYLKSVIPGPKIEKNSAYYSLVEVMERYLEKYRDPACGSIQSLLDKTPIIQQADHSHLLFNQETFLNNILHARGVALNGHSHIFVSQCSTVSCLSRRSPPAGPFFLNIDDGFYKISPVSNRTMKDGNFCTIPGPISLEPIHLAGPKNHYFEEFLSAVAKGTYETPQAAFRFVNNEIWGMFAHESPIQRISFDEDLTSMLAIFHLQDKSSPLYRLIFDQRIRRAFLSIKRHYIAHQKAKSVNFPTPDFFWLKKKSKLRALECDISGSTDRYIVFENGEYIDFDVTPENVIKGLEKRYIYVDRIISYLLRCILPGVVALGGTSQQDYMNLYQKILLELHEETSLFDDFPIKEMCAPHLSAFGGAPLIEVLQTPDFFSQIICSDNINERMGTLYKLPVIQTINTFSSAQYLIKN